MIIDLRTIIRSPSAGIPDSQCLCDNPGYRRFRMKHGFNTASSMDRKHFRDFRKS